MNIISLEDDRAYATSLGMTVFNPIVANLMQYPILANSGLAHNPRRPANLVDVQNPAIGMKGSITEEKLAPIAPIVFKPNSSHVEE